MYVDALINRIGQCHLVPGSPLVNIIRNVFAQLPVKRQTHLNSVTQLSHEFMRLRRRYEPAYPRTGSEPEVEQFVLKLLFAYNLHDFGDIPVEIPKEFIYTNATARRRLEIMGGDWISSAPYDADKFDPPIRGYLIHRSIMAALDADEPIRPPLDSIITQLGLQNVERRKLGREEREQLEWNALVAYQHHEYYDGKGWPRGVKLAPRDPLMDVTFADFQSGWYADKLTRGANARKITASLPAEVLAAMDQRQEESLRRTPGGEPMYNRFWLAFAKEHLVEVDAIVEGIFPDVRKRREQLQR